MTFGSVTASGELRWPLRARLVGPFALLRPDGARIEIPHAKNRALLALLLAAPGRERSRRWLEATLWSDRGEKEASQSLRTALSALRRALGDHKAVIASDRHTVRLIEGGVVGDIEDATLREGDPDILEGLDIRDEAFEAWLTAFRRECDVKRIGAAPAPKAAPAKPRLIVGCISPGATRIEEYIAEALLNYVDRSLCDTLGERAQLVFAPARAGGHALTLRATAVEDGDLARMSLRLEDAVTQRRIWDGRASLKHRDALALESRELLRLAHGAASAVIGTVPSIDHVDEDGRRQALLSRAVREMFTFDPAKLQLADGLIQAAANGDPRPIHLAWRALLFQFILAERAHNDLDTIRARSAAFARAALEGAPDNAEVAAICSVVIQLIDGGSRVGKALAQRAISENPSNVIGYAGLTVSLLRDDRPEEAMRVAERALSIASTSPMHPWFEMFRSLAALSCENYEAASESAEIARVSAPQFRPPLRHLYALHLRDRNYGLAEGVATKLRNSEPDFSMQRMRDDVAYPAATLRASPLIDVDEGPLAT